MKSTLPHWIKHFLCFSCVLLGQSTILATPLSLSKAQQLAIAQSSELKSLESKCFNQSELAIAKGQLDDPKLILGTMNVPVNSFTFNQEPMTQVQVGVMQKFPRGRTLRYLYLQQSDLSTVIAQEYQLMRLEVLRKVRLSWLMLAYALEQKRIILREKSIFRHLVKVSESMLANNKAQQKDVIRAQLELATLDNRLYSVDQQMDVAKADLARWIGEHNAGNADLSLPLRLGSVLPLMTLQQSILRHPILSIEQAKIASAKAGIKLAEQQYKPGVDVSVVYGFRQGKNMDNSNRPDFISAMLVVDLPVFWKNRQNRGLQASLAQLEASEQDRVIHYRDLKEKLSRTYAMWRQQRKSDWLYRKHLIPMAKQYANATMAVYRNAQTDFPTLARAYVRELDVELEGIRAVMERETSRIELLYLEGK
ncbi:MAG: TolC family protein [Coxiellaceae bacterium]|nr:TolC family protein [Coxiellaceae bacterium]